MFTIHGSISLKLELLELRFQDVSINLIIVNDKNAGLKSFFRDLILRLLLLDYTISTFIRVFIVLEIKDNCLFSTRKLLLHLLAVFSQELVVNEKLPLHVCSALQNILVLLGSLTWLFLAASSYILHILSPRVEKVHA